MASKAHRLRNTASSELVIRDGHKIEPEKQFTHRLSCNERLPGLCATTDEPIFIACVKLAESLEQFFSADHMHRFARIDYTRDAVLPLVYCRPECKSRHMQSTM